MVDGHGWRSRAGVTTPSRPIGGRGRPISRVGLSLPLDTSLPGPEARRAAREAALRVPVERGARPPENGRALTERLDTALGSVAARHGNARATVVLAWVLAWPGVAACSVAASRAAHLADWTNAGRLKLTGRDLDAIRAALEEDRDRGPTRPPTVP